MHRNPSADRGDGRPDSTFKPAPRRAPAGRRRHSSDEYVSGRTTTFSDKRIRTSGRLLPLRRTGRGLTSLDVARAAGIAVTPRPAPAATRRTGTGATGPRPARGPARSHRRVNPARKRRRLHLLLATGTAVALIGCALHATARGPFSPATSGTTAATIAPARVSLSVAGSYTVPGSLDLRWPASGQSAISVEGIGTIGTHGPVGTPVPIASVTKTMTAYLVLQDHPLNPGDSGPTITVRADEAAAYAGQAALNQSLVRVEAGEQITERQALQALLLASADNMAQILGRWDAGSDPAFLAEMNNAAGLLGMTNTDFTDPSGYDPGTRSTATDLLLLADKAMSYPAFADIVAESAATVPVQGTVRNYNTLLGTDGVVGIKTGSTTTAGGCLLFAARHVVDGREVTIVGVVLGVPGGDSAILPNALTAARKLLASAEDQLGTATIASAGTTLATVTGGAVTSPAAVTALIAATDVTTTGWPGLTVTLAATGTPAAPALTVTAPDGDTLATAPLAARA